MEPFTVLPKRENSTKSTRYRASRYNIKAVEPDGSMYITNTMSGAFMHISDEQVPYVDQLLKHGADEPLDGLAAVLKKQGFIVREDINEFFRARMLHEMVGRSEQKLRLIFLTTEQCNFRCKYCYEKFEKGKLQPEVIQGVKTFLQHKVRFLNRLHMSWFGGEPLLALDAIEEISQYVIPLCEQNGVQYRSNMTTNAYLLTKKNIERLFACRVFAFQITLDGDAEQHNANRYLQNGAPTFETIFQNLLHLKERLEPFRCKIRINFDQTNVHQIPSFIQKLRAHFGEDPRFRIDYFPIGKWGGDNDENLEVLSLKESVKHQLDLCTMGLEEGLNNDLEDILKPGGYVCYAAKSNSFVIGSDGIVYKCTVALYNENNQIGRITPDGQMRLDADKHALWIMNDESEDSGCKSCFLRPSCQGASCPLVRIEKGVAPCPPLKSKIKDVIRIVGKEKRKMAVQKQATSANA